MCHAVLVPSSIRGSLELEKTAVERSGAVDWLGFFIHRRDRVPSRIKEAEVVGYGARFAASPSADQERPGAVLRISSLGL